MINWPYNRAEKKNAFVLVSTDLGSMIVNRFDYNTAPNGALYGVGSQLLDTSSFDSLEINQLLTMLVLQKQLRGDGVVMIDGGANIGVHSLAAGRLMQGWGSVISFEAQERVFYALAGNIALNNLFNVQAKWNALSHVCGAINIPSPNHLTPSSFGSLELQYSSQSENIGQTIDTTVGQQVEAISIDHLKLPRLDFMKLDVEGMEEQVIRGAAKTIARTKPIIHVETIKSQQTLLDVIGAFDYVFFNLGANTLCVPAGDKILEYIK